MTALARAQIRQQYALAPNGGASKQFRSRMGPAEPMFSCIAPLGAVYVAVRKRRSSLAPDLGGVRAATKPNTKNKAAAVKAFIGTGWC
jgi:hypothetical protein